MYLQLTLTVCLTIWQSQALGGVISRDADDSDICESDDCHKAAQQILKWLNPEVNPCDDFYEFACGNWKNLLTNEREQQALGARGTLADKFIPVLIKDPSTTNGNMYFGTLRNFMITCMDEETIRSLGVSPIKQLIQKAGGWPVLDADWSEESWDFLNAEITLGGVLITVDTVYHLDDNSSVVTFPIYLGPSTLIERYTPNYNNLVEGLKNGVTKAYYDKMVEMAVALGAEKDVAEKDMKDALEFEIALIEEFRKTNFLGKKTITFEELQEAVPWLDLTELLEVYLPESFELLPEEIIISRKKYFIVLDKIINQYPTRTLVNYMTSKAVYPLMDYVLTDDNVNRANTEEKNRLKYCNDIVTDGSLGPALTAFLAIMNTDASKVALEMTKVIIEELSKEVEEYDWLDDVTRREAAKNTSKIKTEVGFPPKIMNLTELDTVYRGYEMDTSTFFDAIIYDKKWKMQRQFDRLRMNFTKDEKFDHHGWRFYLYKALEINAHYIQQENAIEVTGPMLYYTPLFSPEYPAYVNYGDAGTIVAHELIHAVDVNAEPHGGYLSAMEKWKNNQTESIYIQKKQCFSDFYSSINDTKLTQMTLNGNYTQREDMADNGGIKLSLRAYRKLADQLGSPEQKLPGLQQYTIEQLFMISTANFFCIIPSKENRIMEIMYNRHSPFEFRVNGMMMNSPDFSEIFNCDKGDPMNPPDKCEVW